MTTRQSLRVGGMLLALALVTGCSGINDTRGSMPDRDLISELRPGVHRREDVAALLGSPSTVATFDKNIWYYIGKTTHQFAFFDAETKDQQVLIVSFGEEGTLQDVRRLGLEDSQSVAMVGRATPTAGETMSVFQQIFGNMGKFNTKK